MWPIVAFAPATEGATDAGPYEQPGRHPGSEVVRRGADARAERDANANCSSRFHEILLQRVTAV